jgi:fucose permease
MANTTHNDEEQGFFARRSGTFGALSGYYVSKAFMSQFKDESTLECSFMLLCGVCLLYYVLETDSPLARFFLAAFGMGIGCLGLYGLGN